MRLASFTPEVTRLRRIAKACAAGELSRSAYRDARQEQPDLLFINWVLVTFLLLFGSTGKKLGRKSG